MKRSPLVPLLTALLLTMTGGVALAYPHTASPPVQVSPTDSPYSPPCNGVSVQVGTVFPGTEVEPTGAVNPANPANVIAGWQQDRWSNGGSNGTPVAYSLDGGTTWSSPAVQPPFTRCAGGNAANGGDYERASDPWVSIGPSGTAYYMSLAIDVAQDNNNAMLVSRSLDGGASWGPITTLRRDTSPNVLNDKNSLTADPNPDYAAFAYAVWDRLEFPNANAARQAGENAIGFRGPTWFTRTTNGGATWEPARMIFDPGEINQTIGNQIVVTADGTLVDGFNLIYNAKNAHKVRGEHVAVLRSTDKGATWDAQATLVDDLAEIGVTDPATGAPVRTGDIIPEIAVAPGTNTVYMVWQDARATGGARDQIALARSTDAGRTWQTVSLAINANHDTQAFNPQIRVLPDGTVGVLYNDFRNDDPTVSPPLTTSTWLAHSHDGGQTWTETQIGGDYDMTRAPVARGYFLGDYDALGAAGTTFTPIFPQTTGTTGQPPADNIYSSTVTP
jgi:hypothetical protein